MDKNLSEQLPTESSEAVAKQSASVETSVEADHLFDQIAMRTHEQSTTRTPEQFTKSTPEQSTKSTTEQSTKSTPEQNMKSTTEQSMKSTTEQNVIGPVVAGFTDHSSVPFVYPDKWKHGAIPKFPFSK